MGQERDNDNEKTSLLVPGTKLPRSITSSGDADIHFNTTSPVRLANHQTLLPLGGRGGLSLCFAILCIIDLFGVFPIVALPSAIITCGWLGLPLAMGVFALQIYTARLLGRCWVIAERINPLITLRNRGPYSALAAETFGPRASHFVSILLDVTVFGGSIPNLLVASQNLQLIGLKLSSWTFEFSFCYWLILVGIALCPIMWLGSPRDMKWLAVTSACTVLSVGILSTVVILQDTRKLDVVPIPAPSWEAVAVAYGVMAFQFDIHPIILTVQVDMNHKHQLGKAVIYGFMGTCSLFLMTMVAAMWRYGGAVTPNLLQGLPSSALLYADVFLVTLQISLSMVVGGCALFHDVEDKLGIPREFNWRRCVVRCVLVMFAVVLGLAVPRFDLIMGFIGGALTGPLMFIFPPLFYLRLSKDPLSGMRPGRKRVVIERVLLTVVVVLGVLATVAASYFSVRETIRSAHFAPPCIVNVTAASRAWINDAFSYHR